MAYKGYTLDLIGQEYGRLTVIEFAGKKPCGNQYKTMWKCQCICGNETIVASGQLRNGQTTSCGCFHKEQVGKINRTHNLSNKCGRLYPLWKSIKYRCYCKSAKDYPRYGGRGIKMCSKWKNDFKSFYDWAISNGYKEEKTNKGLNILTIDRIDVNGDYEPDNCRFITNLEQARNKRNTMTEAERNKICPVCGVTYQLRQRKGALTCSYRCGVILRERKRRLQNELQKNVCDEKIS